MTDALFSPEPPGAGAPAQPGTRTPTEGPPIAIVIPLLDKDGNVTATTLVDPDIYPALARWQWSLNRDGYAQRSRTLGNGKKEVLTLHRVVMCCTTGDGMEVDHVNQCRLDNRRSNLRFVTHLENMHNRGKRPRPRWRAEKQRWYAAFTYRGKSHWVGSFADHADAERALDAAYREAVSA